MGNPLPAQPGWSQHLLDVLPAQGQWSDGAYLWLSGNTNRLVELDDGVLEFGATPTEKHQAIVRYFHSLLRAFLGREGITFFAPLRLRLRSGRFREPDVLALRSRHDPRRGPEYWTGADLVMEVVSPDDPQRDWVTKRADYAAAGIPEYWIVDPQQERVCVLTLDGADYREHGEFGRGTLARSAAWPLEVPVSDLFAAED
ncbi:MAG: Uma2 family endonuclease [Deltaproteobacteria bacterium]|nr:Uma2 family endonuclease [Deltaproteobacteria bacterium]